MRKPSPPLVLFIVVLLAAAISGRARAAAVKDTARVTVLVDTDGTALVRWILPEGPLPAKGFRLERSIDGGPRQAIATLVPGAAADALADPKTAPVIRDYIALAADPRAALHAP